MERCDIEAVGALLDGELSQDEAARLRGHIETCPSCRALYDDMAALRDGFAALEIDPPDTLAPGIMYKIGLGEEPPRGRRIIRSLVSVAACLVVVLIVSRVMDGRKLTDLSYSNTVLEKGSEGDSGLAGGAPEAPGGYYTDGFTSNEEGDNIQDSIGEAWDAEWEAQMPPDGMPVPAPEIQDNAGLTGGNGFDCAAFLRLLDEDGLTFFTAERDADSILSVAGLPVWAGGELLTVYEYASNEDMEYDAGHIDPYGHTISLPDKRAKITWAAAPHFFKKDLLIVLYVGENEDMLRFLDGCFGARFAGG